MDSKNSLWYGDLHVHTNLSNCAPKETVPSSYIPYCNSEEIKTIGFSNHIYPNSWIRHQEVGENAGFDRVMRIRPDLEKLRKSTDLRILLGGEVEVVYGKEPSLTKELSKNFDYILIAASHVMNIMFEYTNYDLSTPDKLRDLIIERFEYACNLDYPVPMGICHPLYALCTPWEQEVIDGISDSKLADCFTLARKKNKSIEIHACLYRPGTQRNELGISPSYLRMLSAAKACGCHFHFGADAHSVSAFSGVHSTLRKAAEIVGITKEDMWNL